MLQKRIRYQYKHVCRGLSSSVEGCVSQRDSQHACINTLLRYARDKIFDRLVKVEKGKSTGRLQAISKRHKTSFDVSSDLILSLQIHGQ